MQELACLQSSHWQDVASGQWELLKGETSVHFHSFLLWSLAFSIQA